MRPHRVLPQVRGCGTDSHLRHCAVLGTGISQAVEALGNNTVRFGVTLVVSSGNGFPSMMSINYSPCSLVRPYNAHAEQLVQLCSCLFSTLHMMQCCHDAARYSSLQLRAVSASLGAVSLPWPVILEPAVLQVTISATGSTKNPAPMAPPSPPSPPPASPSPPPPPRC